LNSATEFNNVSRLLSSFALIQPLAIPRAPDENVSIYGVQNPQVDVLMTVFKRKILGPLLRSFASLITA
jgi:hypothetical protein